MTKSQELDEHQAISMDSVFSLRPNERVLVGVAGRRGTVDRVDGTGTVYVYFGDVRAIDKARLIEECAAEDVERA